MPFGERQRWVNAQSNAEAKRELGVIWEMFKKDPLSPLNAYCSRYVVTGFGMFTEGYTIFCEYTPRSVAQWHTTPQAILCQVTTLC